MAEFTMNEDGPFKYSAHVAEFAKWRLERTVEGIVRALNEGRTDTGFKLDEPSSADYQFDLERHADEGGSTIQQALKQGW